MNLTTNINARSISNKNTKLILVSVLSYSIIATLAIIGRPVVVKVAENYSLIFSDNPYFQPQLTGILYLLLPLVIFCGIALFLFPGVMVLIALGGDQRIAPFLIKATGLTLGLLLLCRLLFGLVFNLNINKYTFVGYLFSIGVAFVLISLYRISKEKPISIPVVGKENRRRIFWVLLLIFIGTVLLIPKLFWENFNGDGYELYRLGRSLYQSTTPVYLEWSPTLLAADLKMILPVYPIFWMIDFYGDVEATARLPILIYIPILFLALIELAETAKNHSLGIKEECVLLLQVAIFSIVMIFNSSYNPWFSDIAAPASHETLMAIFLISSAYFMWNKKIPWILLFGFLGFFIRPTFPILLFFIAFLIEVFSNKHRNRVIGTAVLSIILAVITSTILSQFFVQQISSQTYSFHEILAKFRYLKFDDYPRLAFLIFPSGILPAISIFGWKWQDSLAKSLSLTTIVYFIFFYFVAYVALHQFVPAMILPIAVFWRIYLDLSHQRRKFGLVLALIGAGISIWLSLPSHFQLSNAERALGLNLDCRVCDYSKSELPNGLDPMILTPLFRVVYEVSKPDQEWGIEPEVIFYYSSRRSDSDRAQPNYVIIDSKDAPPPGFLKVADKEGVSIYVKNIDTWKAQQTSPSLSAGYRRFLYHISPQTLFKHIGLQEESNIIDLLPYYFMTIQSLKSLSFVFR